MNNSGVNTILLVVVIVLLVAGGMWWYTTYGPAAPETQNEGDASLQIQIGGDSAGENQ